MKNTFENAIKFRKSYGFEFFAYDDNGNEVLYTRCEDNYKELYEVSLEFARRFIEKKCACLKVTDLWLNDVMVCIYRGELIASEGSKQYEVACQIIGSLCEV